MKIKVLLAICVILAAAMPMPAYADSNYKEYIYNTEGESVAAPRSYQVAAVICGDEETGKVFSAPRDLGCDKNGNLYVLDSGNNRIVVYDSSFKLKEIINPPKIGDDVISFTSCTGIFLASSGIYLADKDNGVIYELSYDGTAGRVITFKPQPVVDKSFVFKPVRLTVDETGIMQVQCEGCYNGLITLDSNGNMIGYFSANTIQASLSVLAAQFWRRIFSDEQQNKIKQIIPVEYSSVTMDSEGFIYTTTKKTETSTFEIKKLNPYGNNILGYDNTFKSTKIGNGDYGDLRIFRLAGKDVDTTFEDIHVDSEGFIFAMDTARGRIFQYDQNSNLISIFGGLGNQKGTFQLPVAVAGIGENVLVLDETKNSITVFEPNDYVRNIRKAIKLDEESNYEEASVYWEKVYAANSNYSLALSGLGKAAYKNGNLKKAMELFKKAKDRTNYDIVYTVYRTRFIRANFAWIALGILAAAIVIVLLYSRFWRKKSSEK